MSDTIDAKHGGCVTVGVGPVQPDNRRPVLLQVNAFDSRWTAVYLTWSEAREVATAILLRCGGPCSDEEGGAP
jgi:hypothetical protein